MTQESKTKTAGQVDWNSFVQQPDVHFESNFTESTKWHMRFMWRNFQRCVFATVHSSSVVNLILRFTSLLQPLDYKYWLKNITLKLVKWFLHWYLETHHIMYQSGFLVFIQYWRVFWCKEMDCLFPYDLRRKMTNVNEYLNILDKWGSSFIQLANVHRPCWRVRPGSGSKNTAVSQYWRPSLRYLPSHGCQWCAFSDCMVLTPAQHAEKDDDLNNCTSCHGAQALTSGTICLSTLACLDRGQEPFHTH